MFVNKINGEDHTKTFINNCSLDEISFFFYSSLPSNACRPMAHGPYVIWLRFSWHCFCFLFLFLSAIRWIWMNLTLLTFILWTELVLLFPLYQGSHVQIAFINWCCQCLFSFHFYSKLLPDLLSQLSTAPKMNEKRIFKFQRE